jgi:iron(III) transport system permease protein
VTRAGRARRRPPIALAVAAGTVAALTSLPLAYLVVRAASGGSGAWEILFESRTAVVVARTLVLAATVTALATALGVALAWVITRTDLPGRRFWAVATALPLVVPSYVAALALIAALGPGAPVSAAIEAVPGVDRAPELFGFPGSVLALTLSTYPYVYLLTAAAMRRLDPALEEAARGLGRSAWATFRSVTLPLLRPSVGAGALLAALYTLSDFGVVSLMRHDVLTRVIFLQYRTLFDRDPAAVLGLVLVILTAVVLVLEARARGRADLGAGAGATPRAARRQPLGRWRPAALALCGTTVALGLVMPVSVLLFWSLRGPSALEALAAVAVPAGSSLAVAAAAALLAVAAATPVGLVSVRFPRFWTGAVERLAYGANALPGVVVALALVFFASRFAGPLYQTIAVLLFAYVVRFLPQALSGARSALVSVNPALEEAARGLGRGARGAFTSVTLPLVAPGLLAGATLVFLSTLKELPVTLLLRPIGFDTLATEVWSATSVSAFSRAAPPALALIVLAAPIVFRLIERTDERDARGEALGAA